MNTCIIPEPTVIGTLSIKVTDHYPIDNGAFGRLIIEFIKDKCPQVADRFSPEDFNFGRYFMYSATMGNETYYVELNYNVPGRDVLCEIVIKSRNNLFTWF